MTQGFDTKGVVCRRFELRDTILTYVRVVSLYVITTLYRLISVGNTNSRRKR